MTLMQTINNWVRTRWQRNPLQILIVFLLIPGSIIFIWILWETVASGNTGFHKKSLWDWMELLLVPSALAFGVLWLNRSEKATERQIASDRLEESALQEYFSQMTEHLLKNELVKSEADSEVRNVARTITIIVLRNINGERKGQVIRFLHESGLIKKPPIVLLDEANLQDAQLSQTNLRKTFLRNSNFEKCNLDKANLWQTDLTKCNLKYAHLQGAILLESTLRECDFSSANLSEAVLKDADLRRAILSHANLSKANLNEADLRRADLREANLEFANLQDAKVTADQLNQARSLRGATLPSGTLHQR